MPKPSRPGQKTRRPRVAGLRKHASGQSGTQQAEREQPESQPLEQNPATGISEPEPTTAGSGAADTESSAPESADAGTPRTAETESDQAGTSELSEHDTVADGPDEPDSTADEAAGSDSATQALGTSSQSEETSEDLPEGSEGDGTETTDSTPPPPPEDGTATGGKRGYGLPALLVGLTVVCTVLAVVFGMQAAQLRGDGAGSNQALADAAATSEVNGQISDAVAKVFSYDFADTAKTEKAANELLVGDAVGKYNELFATIKEQAPKQKLVVTTTVKTSAVKLLQDDRAEVLLFVDQNAVRTDSGENNIGPAQILVGAEKQGDQWKINQITQL